MNKDKREYETYNNVDSGENPSQKRKKFGFDLILLVPDDCIRMIYSFLNGNDVLTLSHTCRMFRDTLGNTIQNSYNPESIKVFFTIRMCELLLQDQRIVKKGELLRSMKEKIDDLHQKRIQQFMWAKFIVGNPFKVPRGDPKFLSEISKWKLRRSFQRRYTYASISFVWKRINKKAKFKFEFRDYSTEEIGRTGTSRDYGLILNVNCKGLRDIGEFIVFQRSYEEFDFIVRIESIDIIGSRNIFHNEVVCNCRVFIFGNSHSPHRVHS